MNVLNIAAGNGPKGPEETGANKTGAGKDKAVGKGDKPAVSDSFASSPGANEARRLVAKLAEGVEARSDLVEKYSALLASGELDSPEAAGRAADALLGLGEGNADLPR